MVYVRSGAQPKLGTVESVGEHDTEVVDAGAKVSLFLVGHVADTPSQQLNRFAPLPTGVTTTLRI